MNLHDKLIKTFSNKFHFNSTKRVADNLLHMWNKVIIPWIDFYIPKNDQFKSALIIPTYLELSPLKHSRAAKSEVDFLCHQTAV